MSDAPNPTQARLAELLRLTRDEEMDCDAYAAALAHYVDGPCDEKTRALIDHHREICPECDETLDTLLRALGRC